MKSKVLLVMMTGLVAILLMAGVAQAVVFFDFQVEHPQFVADQVTYDGVGGPLVGTNIEVESVNVSGAPLNNGFYPITDGLLNFTTGAFDSSGALNWVFNGGGSITINGNIALNPLFDIDMSGTFAGNVVAAQNSDPDTTHSIIADFTDTKGLDWLTLFGINDPNFIGTMNLSFATPTAISPGDAINSSVTDVGAVHNTVPVPPAVWLFGSGLLALVGLRRKVKA
ncbi:MAG: hypothetical protein WC443_11380 [Desulfobaccales bacterium]